MRLRTQQAQAHLEQKALEDVKNSSSYTSPYVAATATALLGLRLVNLSWDPVMQGRRAKLLYPQPHVALAGIVLLKSCLYKIRLPMQYLP